MSQSISPAASAAAWTCWSSRSHVPSADQVGTFVDGLPRTEPFDQVTPLHAGPDPVKNPVDHLAVIPPPASTPVADREKWPSLIQLGIRQITPPQNQSTPRSKGKSDD